MMSLIDWNKEIYCVFSNDVPIKAFIVGNSIGDNMIVGIPDPDSNDKGIMLQVDKFGRSVKTGMQIIENKKEPVAQ